MNTVPDPPAPRVTAVDPAAELIRAALAWSERSPSIGEAHANLKHAAALYRDALARVPPPAGSEDQQ
jgi:hypothetical protein